MGLTRAARQRLEAEGAGSGKEVQHARIKQFRMHDAHPRFLDAVGGWPHARIPRRLEVPALPLPGDDAHGLSRYGRKSARRSWRSPFQSSRSSLKATSIVDPTGISGARHDIPHPIVS
jgi:hypothetical protein